MTIEPSVVTAWLGLGAVLLGGSLVAGLPTLQGIKSAQAQEMTSSPSSLRVVVNSNQDGDILPDQDLTLREAIALQNGVLSLEDLSAEEQAQVSPGDSKIEFDLPSEATTIALTQDLPPIVRDGLIVDGTSQLGQEDKSSETSSESESPAPSVALTPAFEAPVYRGLTLAANNITVRGLSFYGFTSRTGPTATTPSADIFVVHEFLPKNRAQAQKDTRFSLEDQSDRLEAPKGIVIESNWLGLTPTGAEPAQRSAFGVYVFNSRGVTIRQNRIGYHSGSGIITGDRATNLVIEGNEIFGNGQTGMADAIRLEGVIRGAHIHNNRIFENGGSGVYLFKTQGPSRITQNQILGNGQRLKRAAIYLMGNGHQVEENEIAQQGGPGIVVAAYPQSQGNVLRNNTFAEIDGLSIDLITRNHTASLDYAVGDGANPERRDTGNRRLDTGNQAVNTPVWLSDDFLLFGDQVSLDGEADPGSTVTLYLVNESDADRGPLSQVLSEVTTNELGRFGVTLTGLKPGDRISAIATVPEAGTSEPSLNAVVRSLN